MALLLINEGPRGFLSLIAGVALYRNLLEDPLFFHFFLLATGDTEETEKLFENKKQKFKIEFCFLTSHLNNLIPLSGLRGKKIKEF